MRLAYDAVLRRPGCVIVQAAMGGSVTIAQLFPSEQWLITPTPDMRVYEITEAQLAQLLLIAEEKAP